MSIENEQKMAAWRAGVDADTENTRAINAAGHAAIRIAVGINGAAAVALLAFLGSVTIRWSASPVPGAAYGMGAFVFGVLLGAVATGCNYAALLVGHRSPSKCYFNVVNAVTILFVVLSLVAFSVGGLICVFVFM